jgi:hypothetical protein
MEVMPGRHVACHFVIPETATAGPTGGAEAKEHNQQGEDR